jgi:hypothetical protein
MHHRFCYCDKSTAKAAKEHYATQQQLAEAVEWRASQGKHALPLAGTLDLCTTHVRHQPALAAVSHSHGMRAHPDTMVACAVH